MYWLKCHFLMNLMIDVLQPSLGYSSYFTNTATQWKNYKHNQHLLI